MKVLKFLIEKEFKQIRRNRFIPKLIIFFPCMMLFVMPWVANFEVKDLKLIVVDNDVSTLSKRLISKASSSEYFLLTDVLSNYDEALTQIESFSADIILQIPIGFEKELIASRDTSVMIAANSVNGIKGALGSGYLTAIVNDFAYNIREELFPYSGWSPVPIIQAIPMHRFNPHLDYKMYMVPALVVMILTMLCGFLPALNIVGEKETGTMEQINVTPIGRFTFILAKLIPYWIMGLLVLTLSLLIARYFYGLIPAGNLKVIYFFACVYILTVSGVGLVISNYSSTLQQAMFIIYFFIMIFILISGLFTPVKSMPNWAQWIATINPLKYFIEVMRFVYLKGSSISEIVDRLYVLIGFALMFNLWAVLSYKKSSS